ncbi:hypothetical protein [Cellulomonas sp.]|uniref:hypothetical protein n=1 Tax=Cellulomonas sp. TaxID=40001 RepID=UPI00258FE931|nr:hypothetical protein [Cellulomonas sp.]MCR6688106.1 hypothetical protein [Cellulomonas sp.]
MARDIEHILASARAIDTARTSGVPDEVIAIMLVARNAARGHIAWPAATDLAKVMECPDARQVDEVLWVQIRRHLRGV